MRPVISGDRASMDNRYSNSLSAFGDTAPAPPTIVQQQRGSHAGTPTGAQAGQQVGFGQAGTPGLPNSVATPHGAHTTSHQSGASSLRGSLAIAGQPQQIAGQQQAAISPNGSQTAHATALNTSHASISHHSLMDSGASAAAAAPVPASPTGVHCSRVYVSRIALNISQENIVEYRHLPIYLRRQWGAL